MLLNSIEDNMIEMQQALKEAVQNLSHQLYLLLFVFRDYKYLDKGVHTLRIDGFWNWKFLTEFQFSCILRLSLSALAA